MLVLCVANLGLHVPSLSCRLSFWRDNLYVEKAIVRVKPPQRKLQSTVLAEMDVILWEIAHLLKHKKVFNAHSESAHQGE